MSTTEPFADGAEARRVENGLDSNGQDERAYEERHYEQRAYDERGYDDRRYDEREPFGPRQARGEQRGPRSPAELLRRLMGDVATLFRKELALAASEIGQSIDEAKRGAGSMVTGGAVLYAGILFLLGAATLAIALVLPAWAAALIVGGVTTLIGLVMVMAGKRKVQAKSFAPSRTVDSLRKDTNTIRRRMQ